MSNLPRIPKIDINGILLLDKPLHLSSNAALQITKRLFRAKKAGHTGSLDPLATGMLPLCFGEATKFSQYLLDADKVYEVSAKLGEQTATGDAEGEIIARNPVPEFSPEQLETCLAKFRGKIAQVPSMYSALKYQGRPLYELARKGIVVDRPARIIEIYKLSLTAQTANTLTLMVNCSKGTYIRTLVEDIGAQLGCGAHVSGLRRLSVACYDPTAMVTLAELEATLEQSGEQALEKFILPISTVVQHLPVLNISAATYFYLRRGQPLLIPYSPATGWLSLMIGERFVGIGEVLEDGKVAPRRLVAENTDSSA